MSNATPAFKTGQAVKIHRPNRKDHGKRYTYVEPGPDPGFAWVAYNKDAPSAPIPLEKLRRQADYPRKLYPLSQIQPHESAAQASS